MHPDSQRYFDIHHAANTDVFENVNKENCTCAVNIMANLLD
jgi:hypothetical protein